jgi:hypothetical protein
LRKRKPPIETKAQTETTAAPLNGGERKKAQVDQRLGVVALPEDQRRTTGEGAGEAGEDQVRAPAVVRRLDDPEDEQAEGEDHQHLAERVEPARVRRLRFRHVLVGEDDRRDPDRDVDPEDRAPVDRLHEDAADQRAAGDADPGDAAPPADRPGALAWLGEDVGDDRHRDRVQHRAADRLDHAEGDQPAEPGGDRAESRADREGDQADLEGAPPAEPVAGRSGQHQEAGDHQRVGVDRPLGTGDRGAEVLLDRRQRDVQDRHVEPDDQHAHAADREHQLTPHLSTIRHRASLSGRLARP